MFSLEKKRLPDISVGKAGMAGECRGMGLLPGGCADVRMCLCLYLANGFSRLVDILDPGRVFTSGVQCNFEVILCLAFLILQINTCIFLSELSP